MNERGGFYDNLQKVPNPDSEERTKGSLEKFNENAHIINQEALSRTREQTNIPLIEYEVEELPDEGEKR